jgi:large subunit ribosomal protein L9
MALKKRFMQVLLNQDVKKLGYRGDIVSVKRGYFRNFLWPNGFAEVADKTVLKLADQRKANIVVSKKELVDKSEDVLKKLKGLKVTVKHKVSDKGTLYSAVVEEDVIAAVEAAVKIKLEKSFITMEHFKDLGEHKVVVEIASGMKEEITVMVESE